mmetsp:Transcript_6185/g.8909  ORF Transcript_6185/g.8909 Transcript_6185/m.8909 type:complete len:90 (+) Transcript_6185:74-343(+)
MVALDSFLVLACSTSFLFSRCGDNPIIIEEVCSNFEFRNQPRLHHHTTPIFFILAPHYYDTASVPDLCSGIDLNEPFVPDTDVVCISAS